MTDSTEQFVKVTAKASESHFFNVSMRAWLALIIVLAACWMSLTGLKVEEPLYTMVISVLGLYFGQREKPKGQ
jgi:hypothetical protein